MITECWTPQSSHRDTFFSIIISCFLLNHTSFSRDVEKKWMFCRLRSGGVQSLISGVYLMDALQVGTAISYLDFFCAFTCVYLNYSITVLYGMSGRVYDKFIIAQIPGRYYWIQRCYSSFGLVATLYQLPLFV